MKISPPTLQRCGLKAREHRVECRYIVEAGIESRQKRKFDVGQMTYARDNSIMACEMRLAVLAAEDLVGVEVGVVDEAHARRLVACGR